MKTKNYLRLIFLSMFCTFCALTVAQTSEICSYLIGSGNSRAYLTVETNGTGQMIVSILPFDPLAETASAYTAFRNNGQNDARVQLITVNGDANTGYKYFTRTTSGADAAKTQIIYTPAEGVTIPTNATIVFPSENLEWRTPSNTNAYGPVPFTYTYGTSCPVKLQLDKPENVAVSTGNVLTFDEDNNASGYSVSVFLSGTRIGSFSVDGSGETISFPVSGNFALAVMAVGDADYDNSELSDQVNWTVSNPDATDLSFSNFCEATLAGGTTGTSITFSIETATTNSGDIVEGDIVVTAHDPKEWRAGGVKVGGWIIGGMAGSGAAFLDEISINEDNPQIFRPKSGITIPKGTLISYSAAGGQALTWGPENGWIDTGTPIVDYVYGTDCQAPQLNPPADLALGAGNVLTFTPDDNAVRTDIVIMSGETTLLTLTGFNSGDAVDFPLNGTFAIKGRSITGSVNYLNSDYSSSIPMVVNLPDATVGVTEYCDAEINPTGEGAAGHVDTGAGYGDDNPDDDTVYFTWETTTGRDIVITLKGKDSYETTTAFRGTTGFNVSNLSIGGIPAGSLVATSGGGAGTTQITFTPVSGITIPLGTTITYNGMVTYMVVPASETTGLDNLWPTIAFSYTYGSTCTGGIGTGITTPVNDQEVVKSQYFTIDGRQVANPGSGIYIVRKTCKDNSVKTEKMFVK